MPPKTRKQTKAGPASSPPKYVPLDEQHGDGDTGDMHPSSPEHMLHQAGGDTSNLSESSFSYPRLNQSTQSQHPSPQSQYASPQSQYASPQSQYNSPQSQHSSPQSQHSSPQSQHSTPRSQCTPDFLNRVPQSNERKETFAYTRPSIHDHLSQMSGGVKPEKPDDREWLETLIDGLLKPYVQTALLLIFIMVVSYLMSSAPSTDSKHMLTSANTRQAMMKDFEARFQSISENFPNQNPRFWKMVRAACKGVLREAKPSQPAVLMLAARQQHSRTAECLARHVVRVFSDTYPSAPPVVALSPYDYAQYPRNDDGDAALKRHIDRTARAAFDGGGRALHVSEVQRVPGRAAAMFHAFCDNDNAPYKDAAIVFTMHAEDDGEVWNDAAVEEYLTELWGEDLDIDTLTPLLSRIANSVALVKGEEDEVLDQHC